MNIEQRLEMLKNYISINVAPILMEDIDISILGPNTVIIPANIELSSLNGQYQNNKFLPPQWLIELQNKSQNNYCILVIDGLTNIKKEEQIKFIEILKYKKIETFALPENCVIIITGQNGSLREEISSLVAII